MDSEAFIREMFNKDTALRYVGIIDSEFHIVASKQRVGSSSLTSDETDREFISAMPPVIWEAVEKVKPFLGQLDWFGIRYEKVLILFYCIGELIVTLSFDPGVVTPFMSRIRENIQNLSGKYLT
ncbi:MAG TPA: hypothetical protein VLV31_01685 [Candidatus Acidoferrales bacterium]|nr:hypothetical protein [Candidatus Acidoferrales bacterium]